MVARFAVALVLWRELQYDFAFRRTGLAVVISLSGRLKAKKREDLNDVRMRERWQLLKRSKRLGDLKSWIVFFFLCVCVHASRWLFILVALAWPRLGRCHRCHGGRSNAAGQEVLHELELARRECVVIRIAVVWNLDGVNP